MIGKSQVNKKMILERNWLTGMQGSVTDGGDQKSAEMGKATYGRGEWGQMRVRHGGREGGRGKVCEARSRLTVIPNLERCLRRVEGDRSNSTKTESWIRYRN